MTAPKRDERSGASEALRSAVERTFAATAGSAVETRERAAELLDDVARRGQEAREEVTRRGQEAREEVTRVRQEAPRAVAGRLSSAIQRLRGGDAVVLRKEIERLRSRVAELEQQLRRSKPKA